MPDAPRPGGRAALLDDRSAPPLQATTSEATSQVLGAWYRLSDCSMTGQHTLIVVSPVSSSLSCHRTCGRASALLMQSASGTAGGPAAQFESLTCTPKFKGGVMVLRGSSFFLSTAQKRDAHLDALASAELRGPGARLRALRRLRRCLVPCCTILRGAGPAPRQRWGFHANCDESLAGLFSSGCATGCRWDSEIEPRRRDCGSLQFSRRSGHRE